MAGQGSQAKKQVQLLSPRSYSQASQVSEPIKTSSLSSLSQLGKETKTVSNSTEFAYIHHII
jgi:hypothetical protein